MSVEYTSDEPSNVRIDDRMIIKGDVISNPPDVVAELAKLPGFRAVGSGGPNDPSPVDDRQPDTSSVAGERPAHDKKRRRSSHDASEE